MSLAFLGDSKRKQPGNKDTSKIKSIFGKKFTNQFTPDLSLNPPAKRDLKGLIAALKKEAVIDGQLWPNHDPDLYAKNIQGWRHMYLHYRWGIGTGGFQAETGGYADIASWIPAIYATAYHRATGENVSPHDDVNVLMVRRLIQAVLNDSKKRSSTVKLNSATGISQDWFARVFPIVPTAYQGPMLTAWNHLAGVTDEASQVNILGDPEKIHSLKLALRFLNYPQNIKPTPLSELPLHWGTEWGHYSFRNNYLGGTETAPHKSLRRP